MEKELDTCQKALMEELKRSAGTDPYSVNISCMSLLLLFVRLEALDALAGQLTAECDSRTPAVEELGKRVSELEASSSGMSSAEVGKVAADLTQEIQVNAGSSFIHSVYTHACSFFFGWESCSLF